MAIIFNVSYILTSQLLFRAALGLTSASQGFKQKHSPPNVDVKKFQTKPNGENVSRRRWLVMVTSGIVSLGPSLSNAAETVGKDDDCNEPNCLGVWGGLLADCPHGRFPLKAGAGCASSQDDTPGVFAEPWDYSESDTLDWEIQMKRLIPAIQLVSGKRGDEVKIITQINRYIRLQFTDGKTSERSIGEFYFTPNDTTIQFRVGSLTDSSYTQNSSQLISGLSSMKNLDRCEAIRKQLGLLKVPVLRNRKRSFFFGESEFDTFGPRDANLGPPEEMGRDVIDGRLEVDPKLKIDFVQIFPQS